MRRFFRTLSGLLFLLALMALAFLLLFDLWSGFQTTVRHRQAEALALIFAGLSFICLQLSAGVRWREMLQGLFLGLAFVLWGGEQFLPAGAIATGIDSVVIAIFVIDLGVIIKGGLNRPAAGTPADDI